MFVSYSLYVSMFGFFTLRQKRIRGRSTFAEGNSVPLSRSGGRRKGTSEEGMERGREGARERGEGGSERRREGVRKGGSNGAREMSKGGARDGREEGSKAGRETSREVP